MQTLNNVSNEFNNYMINLASSVNKNETVIFGTLLILVIYSVILIRLLPTWILEVFDNFIIQFIVTVFIVYLSIANPTIGLLCGIALLLTISTINKNKIMKMSKINENMENIKQEIEQLGQPGQPGQPSQTEIDRENIKKYLLEPKYLLNTEQHINEEQLCGLRTPINDNYEILKKQHTVINPTDVEHIQKENVDKDIMYLNEIEKRELHMKYKNQFYPQYVDSDMSVYSEKDNAESIGAYEADDRYASI